MKDKSLEDATIERIRCETLDFAGRLGSDEAVKWAAHFLGLYVRFLNAHAILYEESFFNKGTGSNPADGAEARPRRRGNQGSREAATLLNVPHRQE